MTDSKDLAVFKGPANSPEATAALDTNGSDKIVIMPMRQYLDEQEDIRARVTKQILSVERNTSGI